MPLASKQDLIDKFGAERAAAFGRELAELAGGAAPEASTPPGLHAENFKINQRVEAFMAEHGVDFEEALIAVTGESGRSGVDPEREALNNRVNSYLDRNPGVSIGRAIEAVERGEG